MSNVHRDPRSFRDEHGVVHIVPENWAVFSWCLLCGYETTLGATFTHEVPTCLTCLSIAHTLLPSTLLPFEREPNPDASVSVATSTGSSTSPTKARP